MVRRKRPPVLSAKRLVGGVIGDRARLEALLASIGEDVLATDAHGKITRINQPALDMLGFTEEELLNQRLPVVMPTLHENGKPLDFLDRPVAKVFLTGQTISGRAFYKRKDGSLLPVQVTASPILLYGRPVGATEVFRDLTDDNLNDKMKSDFISVASHQLRTPLSSINIYTKMLEEGMAGSLNKQQHSFVNIILDSVERMNELINTLLNITRIEAGGIMIRPQPVRLGTTVKKIIAEAASTIESKGLNLKVKIPANVPAVTTDSLLVKEMYANLLSNAIKYTPVGGVITVSLLSSKNDVVFQVVDTGCGIPADAQKHVFSKFFRAENAVRDVASGTGLGLYLTKTLAENLGGEVWFESVENEGSSFYISLPKDARPGKPGKITLSD